MPIAYRLYKLIVASIFWTMLMLSAAGVVHLYEKMYPRPQLGIIQHRDGIPYVHVVGGWKRVFYSCPGAI